MFLPHTFDFDCFMPVSVFAHSRATRIARRRADGYTHAALMDGKRKAWQPSADSSDDDIFCQPPQQAPAPARVRLSKNAPAIQRKKARTIASDSSDDENESPLPKKSQKAQPTIDSSDEDVVGDSSDDDVIDSSDAVDSSDDEQGDSSSQLDYSSSGRPEDDGTDEEQEDDHKQALLAARRRSHGDGSRGGSNSSSSKPSGSTATTTAAASSRISGQRSSGHRSKRLAVDYADLAPRDKYAGEEVVPEPAEHPALRDQRARKHRQPAPLLEAAAEVGAVWTACVEQRRPQWSSAHLSREAAEREARANDLSQAHLEADVALERHERPSAPPPPPPPPPPQQQQQQRAPPPAPQAAAASAPAAPAAAPPRQPPGPPSQPSQQRGGVAVRRATMPALPTPPSAATAPRAVGVHATAAACRRPPGSGGPGSGTLTQMLKSRGHSRPVSMAIRGASFGASAAPREASLRAATGSSGLEALARQHGWRFLAAGSTPTGAGATRGAAAALRRAGSGLRQVAASAGSGVGACSDAGAPPEPS